VGHAARVEDKNKLRYLYTCKVGTHIYQENECLQDSVITIGSRWVALFR